MPEDIRKNRLLVISDTAIYHNGKTILAFEPVVRELRALEHAFDEIVWLGCRISSKSTALRAVNSEKIKVVAMPGTSHKTLNALRVLISYPVFLFYILKYLPSATHVHTRAPSHPAILGILFSFFDRRRLYWHKYAGDWITPAAPYTYRLQRRWLKALNYSNIRVTVNGKWQSDPAHVYAFENPCIFEEEQHLATGLAQHKDFSSGLSLLFVGNIDSNKGILELLEAAAQPAFPERFTDLYIIGGGPLLEEVRRIAGLVTKIRIHITGHINRDRIDECYRQCNVLTLPSKSEGFPKVIAEAAAHGCIPVATDISSISQYIVNGVNGYLFQDSSPATIAKTLNQIAQAENLADVSKNAVLLSKKFTYERFTERIQNEIFNR
jgi:glycosyltransferase involved in cell wall biosynthesis